jgi:uncharacterized delta-60 repeat protein
MESRQLLSAGQLDPTFGGDGVVTVDGGMLAAEDVVAEPNGAVTVFADDDRYRTPRLARYRADGTLDMSFGANGFAAVNTGDPSGASAQSLLRLEDGRYVVAGRLIGSGRSFYVARFRADGTPDPSFGNGGLVRFKTDGGPTGRLTLAARPDGKLVVVATQGYDVEDAQDLLVLQLKLNGRIDKSFGDKGYVRRDFGGTEEAWDAVLQADGKLLIGVTRYNVPPGQPWRVDRTMLWRLNADGSDDSSFGNGGLVDQDLGGTEGSIQGVAVGLDGSILAISIRFPEDRSGLTTVLNKYDATGAADTGFGGGDGEIQVSSGMTGVGGMLVQPDGRILVAGGEVEPGHQAGRGPSDMMVRRFNADGTVDATYGTGGATRTPVGDSSDSIRAAALSQSGHLIVAGTTFGDEQDVVIARYEGGAGSGGSRFATLRRGHDQQAAYTGRKQRSPKRRAMELAQKQREQAERAEKLASLVAVAPPPVAAPEVLRLLVNATVAGGATDGVFAALRVGESLFDDARG